MSGYGLAFLLGGWPFNSYSRFGYPGYFGYSPYGYGGFGGYGYGGLPYYYGGGYPGGYSRDGSVAATPPSYQRPTESQIATDFVTQGETAFRAGDYAGAARAWRHAMVDQPENPALVLLLAQALFAMGQYGEAAGAVQFVVQMPDAKADTVVANHRELYGNLQDYTDQLRALEQAVKENPQDPGLRFLLGYHYGYLSYPAQAVAQLDKAIEVAPKDVAAKKLRDTFAAKVEPPEGQARRENQPAG